jgi:2-oxoglutarate/2-oxoacid ferredoxin oxidoreductase subunit beta
VRELLKAAFSHRGTAFLDIISPCVAFNNEDDSPKSYAYGRDHEKPLQELGYIPSPRRS